MSHLITNTLPLQDKPLIHFVQRTFIKPDLKKIIRAQTHQNQISSHQAILDQLCCKLSNRQSARLSQQNNNLFINYKQKLKHQRNSSLRNLKYFFQLSSVIEEIFTRDQERSLQERIRKSNKNHISVQKYLQKMPEKVYLHQRYNNTINQKINALQQARQIQKQKQTYRNWHNQNNNSPIKNPNFTKMTFLLQKLSSERKILTRLDQNINSGQFSMAKLVTGSPRISSHQKPQNFLKHCIPNVTLQPISKNKYCPKYCSKQSKGSDLVQVRK